ncbi:hypothetical protein F0U62_26980 [Cystobacter fuscus]|uniref:hypothetical protein n=1 Tax=Cystobacter fuscus TaxID=43 RepID=UPI002B2DF1E9|nr:hypothetical protein F0U62_26980 [Cystobacter fuscus]
MRPAGLALVSLLLLAGCATGAIGGSGGVAGEVSTCATQALAPGWPDLSSGDSQALLAPFLSCASPGDFLALQRRVDMPRLVARLEPWSAVRLGALGPVCEEASGPLNRQRTVFLLQSLERYGAANTEVLAHFVLDSCHDDDLRDILRLLAQDKRLTELLEQLPSLGPALNARGLEPSSHPERDFQWSDVGRGLSRAAKDALSTSPVVNGAQSTLMALQSLKAQLPPPYQRALDAVEHEQLEQRFSAGSVAVGVVDHMTFGVPLGFYGLVAGTSQGAHSLVRGRYEQAVRELAPAAMLVALYAGGRGVAWLSEGRGVPGVGTRVLSGLEVVESRVKGLQDMARRGRELLGEEGMRELAGYIRARREAGRLVAVGGVDAALALHETRGNVAQAQAMLSRAHPEATGSSTGRGGTKGASAANEAARPSLKQGGGVEHPATLAAWVDERSGLTREVVQAKLAAAELETASPRLPRDVAVLEKQRPSLDASPPEAQGNPRWSEYVAYYERRLAEIKEGKASKGPLRWEAYERLWGWFTRGLAFERTMVERLKADAALPRAQRRFLGDFDKPRIETYVGVRKPDTGLRFVDVLIIEEGELAGGQPRVETLSFKSRDLSGLNLNALKAQLLEDAWEALWKYGETLNIRRDSLQLTLRQGREVSVSRIRLVYEGGVLMPRGSSLLDEAVSETRAKIPEVEVLFQ